MKSTKILALIMALLLLVSAMFVLASCYDNEDDKDKQSSSTEPSSSSESTASTTKADRHTVTIVDGITGKTLETLKVRNNSTVTLTNNYNAYHYGYNIDTVKLMAELSAKVTADKTITIDFVEAPVYTITLQGMDKNVYTSYEFNFKERLTKKEIQTGKDTLNFVGDDKNDFKTTKLNGQIKVYGGASMNLSDLPEAPTTLYTFDKWILVDANDNPTFPFTGSNITANITIRAQYKTGGVVMYADANLAAYENDKDVFNNIHIATRDGKEYRLDDRTDSAVTFNSTNNEKITFGDETQRATKEDGTFRYVHGLVKYIYSGDSSFKVPAASPEENKFTGVSSSDYFYNNWNIQIDQNSYMAFDGENLYILTIVRDDTPFYFSDSELAHVMSDSSITQLYGYKDTLELYFYFGPQCPQYIGNTVNDREGNPHNPQQYWNAGQLKSGNGFNGPDRTEDQADGLRAIHLDRSATIRYDVCKEPDSFTTSMYNYVDIVDISGSDSDNRNSLALYNSKGAENGYAVGLKFRIQEYFDAIGYNWVSNMCKIVYGMQIDDRTRLTATSETDATDVIDVTDMFNVPSGYKLDQYKNLISAGVQKDVDTFIDITLVKA